MKDLTALSSFSPTDQYGTTGDEGVEKICRQRHRHQVPDLQSGDLDSAAHELELGGHAVQPHFGNDAPERDPRVLHSKSPRQAAAGSWTVIDTRTNQGFSNRHQTRVFTANPTNLSFSYYRLNITANHSGGITRLAEWRLFSSTGGSVVVPSAPTGLLGHGPQQQSNQAHVDGRGRKAQPGELVHRGARDQ